jgi:transcriptional regulator with PAS, ATPase and Fis domain
MQKKKIRILGIAPYAGLKVLMESVAAEHPEIEAEIFSGDRQEDLDLALNMDLQKFDAIISRGATAELLSQNISLPVIEIGISGSDILHSIKLAENYSGRYAIVGFPSIARNAKSLCDLLQYQTDIYTWQEQEEIVPLLEDLKNKGYDIALCDTIADTLAKQHNFNSILITSGSESVENAVIQAEKAGKAYRQLCEQRSFTQALLQNCSTETAAFDKYGRCVFSSLRTLDMETLKPFFTRILKHSNDSELIRKEIDEYMVTFNIRDITDGNEVYKAFYLDFCSVSQIHKHNNIVFFSSDEVSERFLKNFHGLDHDSPVINSLTNEASLSRSPVLISGEPGTGKLQTAAQIYRFSRLQKRPFVFIDTSALDGKGLNYLSSNINSPFFENNMTFCFYRLEALSSEQLRIFSDIIYDTDVCRRNRVFFCCSTKPGQPLEKDIAYLADRFMCINLKLSPLREHPEEIPALACLYMADFNLDLANQTTGFEQDAMQLICQYSWSQNILQFRRVMRQLMASAKNTYICAGEVQKALNNEHSENPEKSSAGSNIDIDRPLTDINSDIARIIVDKCGGNQTVAAKQLGISRTTLWRMIKK